jgi:hypothetical protein
MENNFRILLLKQNLKILGLFGLIAVAAMFQSCKKECKERPGYTIVESSKNGRNCVYEKIEIQTQTQIQFDTVYIDKLDTVPVEIKSIGDISGNIGLMKYAASKQKFISITFLDFIKANETHFPDLRDFGKIAGLSEDKVRIEMSVFYICPSSPGIHLTYGEWILWGRPRLGANNGNGAKFNIDAIELDLFVGAGLDPSSVNSVTPTQDVTKNIGSEAQLQSAVQEIDQLIAEGGYNITVNLTGDFYLHNGAPLQNMVSLLAKLKDGAIAMDPASVGKIGPATDSVHIADVEMLQSMHNFNILKETTLGGLKYFYVSDGAAAAQLYLYSASQAIRTGEMNTSAAQNLSQGVDILPGTWKLNSEYDAGKWVDLIKRGWTRQMKIQPVANPELPGGEWYVVGTTDEFLDNLGEPAAPNPNAILQALDNLILGKYINNSTFYSQNGMDVGDIKYGTGNNNGPKLEASYAKVNDKLKYIQRKRQINHKLILSTQNQVFIDNDGNIIVSMDWLRNVVSMTNINTAKLQVENFNIVLSGIDEMFFGMQGQATFENTNNLQTSNCNYGTQVTPGKQVYGINSYISALHKAPVQSSKGSSKTLARSAISSGRGE